VAPVAGAARSAAAIIHAALVAQADPDRAAFERAYLKDSFDEHLGVSVPLTRRIVGDWRRDAGPTPTDTLAVARELWCSPVFDDRRAAAELWVAEAPQLGPDHLDELAAMVAEGRTWALVDPLAHVAAGIVLTGHPGAAGVADTWSTDASFWVRRLSVLCLSRPVRAGVVPFATFDRIADRLVGEREFFVAKAIGWVLRDIGRHDPASVAEWCAPRMARMSGVTWREARKTLAPPLVAELEARRAGGV
jgi:3-methyladenine DNA glycosylase AlkD